MATSTRTSLSPADPEAERSPAQVYFPFNTIPYPCRHHQKLSLIEDARCLPSPEKDRHEKEKPLAHSAPAALLRTSRTQGRRCAARNLFHPSSTWGRGDYKMTTR